tara:strand:+ start:145024 stop:146388 length:1365 start_codon:yes stop_codon:yes gene_type:complete
MEKILINTLTFLTLSACSLSTNYIEPSFETPKTWEGSNVEHGAYADQSWWETFGDTTLNELIEQALLKNTDITAGMQVVAQSRAAVKLAGGNLWPTLDINAGISQASTNSNNGDSFTNERLSAGLSASYELDLFGGNKEVKNAAQANLLSSVYAQEALKLVIMGDVAYNYFTLLNLNERIEIADKNLLSRLDVLNIIQVRVDEGVDSYLELAQQKTLVANAQAARSKIVELRINTKNALAILLGKAPQGFNVHKKELTAINIPNIPVVQPSDLLKRRPDIKAAEANLKAANANVGVARSALYPSISLGVDDIFSAASFSTLSTNVLTLAANITAPIFNGGQLNGKLDQATAKELELIENYRGIVYSAFQDVENALAAVKSAQEREEFLQTAMEESLRAYTLSKELYDAGSIDFSTLLDTQISLLSAEDNYAEARLSKLTSSVDLFKAMGGSWKI